MTFTLAQKVIYLGNFRKKLSPTTLKNRPIWSHCWEVWMSFRQGLPSKFIFESNFSRMDRIRQKWFFYKIGGGVNISVTRFGENITLVQNFKMVILCIWQNFEPNLFQIYYCNWSNFRCCKWPNIEKEI